MSKMLESHRKVLTALADNEGYFFGFSTLTFETKLERREVRRIVRHLARRGLTEYAKGLWNEDGDPCGAGYRITDLGMASLYPSAVGSPPETNR